MICDKYDDLLYRFLANTDMINFNRYCNNQIRSYRRNNRKKKEMINKNE